jgi:UrcA family protein
MMEHRTQMKTTMKKTMLAGFGALLLATGFAAPAGAADSVKVRYEDLNLATPAGNAVLLRRIKQAATVVCPEYRAGDVRRIRIFRPCYQEAVAHAVANVRQPSLTALLARTGDAPFSMPR